MALIIPRSVGGTADVEITRQAPIEPIEKRSLSLIIPTSVGGEEPPSQAPVEPAQSAVPLASSLQEIGASPQLNELSLPSFLASAGALFTFKDKEVGDILQAQFPGTKIDQDEQGNLVATFQDGGTFAINKPGVSGQDIAKIFGLIGAFTPAGRVAALGKTALQKAGIGAAGAGVTESLIQAGQRAVGGEFDPEDVALSTAFGGAVEAAVPAIQGIRQGRQAKALGVEKEAISEVKPIIQQAEAVTKQTGIELAPAQKTLDPFALEEQSFLGSLPASARTAVKFLKTQNKQAQSAVKEFFSDLAPSDALQAGNVKARDAAKSVVELTKDIRSQASKPFYKRAFQSAKEERVVVDVDATLAILDKALAKTKAPSSANSELSAKRKLIANSSEIGTTKSFAGEPIRAKGTNMNALHRAKVLLAEAIEAKGEKGLDKTVKGDLSQAFTALKTAMEGSSPAYRDAQRIFAQASGPVDVILASKIGQISKITDAKINTVSRQIFDEAITDPKVIAQTRKAIESVDPEAWSSIVRVEAQRRLKNIDLDVSNLTPDNAPAKIARALFGTGNKRALLLSSLTPIQKKNAIMLEEALKRAAQGRPGGSQTGVRGVITESLKGTGLAIRRFIKNPVDRLISTGEDSAFNSNAKSLADSVFNTKWQPQLSKIRELKSDSPAAARAMTQLLNDIEKEEQSK